MEEEPFYGKVIVPEEEQMLVDAVIEKYRSDVVDGDVHKKVYHDLMMEKHKGNITIPFQVNLVKDPYSRYPDYIEVILETKV